MSLALAAFAYLGTFTRYLADDYCDTVLTAGGSAFDSLINRYLTVSDRYSNLLFAGLSEFLLPGKIQVLPVFMILLWTLALIWLVHEVRSTIDFQGSRASDVFLGGMLAFFPLFEAPNRFQTVYWRSAMATHFAPLVYLIAFTALLLGMIRRMDGQRPGVWPGILCVVLAFFGGGFSEPPDAMLIVASALALTGVWIWGRSTRRRAALYHLGWTLAGAIMALVVMGVSPANSFRLRTPPPGFSALIYRTLLSTFQFILDSLHILPLPTVFSIAIPFLLFYGWYVSRSQFSSHGRRLLFILILAVPFLMYVMIAASFAPSIYGQSYPVERARFAGRLIMTTALSLEGALAGMLAAQWRWIAQKFAAGRLAFILLLVCCVYPLRAGWTVLQQDLPEYSQWASAWDARQARILAQKAQGEQDIVVPQLPGIGYVKELDTRKRFWVNRCAATFYDVNSISAVPFGRDWQDQ